MIAEFKDEHRWLSNFWPCDIEWKGKRYPSVEHFYAAMKCASPVDAEGVRLSSTAGLAKRLARKAPMRADWSEAKERVMLWALRQKFRQPDLRKQLLATGDEVLVEGNWWHDNFWGSCNCPRCGGVGQNRLGKMLMRVRDELRLNSLCENTDIPTDYEFIRFREGRIFCDWAGRGLAHYCKRCLLAKSTLRQTFAVVKRPGYVPVSLVRMIGCGEIDLDTDGMYELANR